MDATCSKQKTSHFFNNTSEGRILWDPGQWIKCLPCKHEDLSSDASTHVKTQVWGCSIIIPVLGGGDRIPGAYQQVLSVRTKAQ